MQPFNRAGFCGALILGLALIGYAAYELVLYPNAGLPTRDFSVIVAATNTLRVGHVLKFGDALGLALLTIFFFSRLKDRSPVVAQLAAIAGAGASVLFVASGLIGLNILRVAGETFASQRVEAETTILLRTVTIAIFEAAIALAGLCVVLSSLADLRAKRLPSALDVFGLLFGALFVANGVIPEEVMRVAAVLSIGWAAGLASNLWSSSRLEQAALKTASTALRD
jgi:hypothetical protein